MRTNLNFAWCALLTICIGSLFGCSSEGVSSDQVVRGQVVFEGESKSDRMVKLISSNNSDCNESGVNIVLEKDGGFSVSRKVNNGSAAQIAQKDHLCTKNPNEWVLIWSSGPYGPAPKVLELHCAVRTGKSECLVTADGVRIGQ